MALADAQTDLILGRLLSGGCIKDFWFIASLLMYCAAFLHFIIFCFNSYYHISFPRTNCCRDAADNLGSPKKKQKPKQKANNSSF